MSQSTRLTMICHGATLAARKGAFPRDEPLDEAERERARLGSKVLKRADTILTSPALRARQTGQALLLDAGIDDALRDLDYGRWTGHTLLDIQAREPEAVSAWLSDPEAAPHGGESVVEMMARISDWLISQKSSGGHTVAITHAAVIRAAVLIVLDAPPTSFWKIDVEALSITDLRSDGRRWILRTCGAAFG